MSATSPLESTSKAARSVSKLNPMDLFDVRSMLSEEECTVVEMKIAESSNKEIADRLLCSERTVRRIISNMRIRLQDSLSDSM